MGKSLPFPGNGNFGEKRNYFVLYWWSHRYLDRQAPEDKRLSLYDQDQVGLHHFSFRAKRREDDDALYAFVTNLDNCKVVHGPEDGPHFAPGYYSILFEDPDGIRVEINHVPGKGHFEGKGRLAPGGPGPSSVYGKEGI